MSDGRKCVVCGGSHNYVNRDTCSQKCWRKKVNYKRVIPEDSKKVYERSKSRAMKKYPCIPCLRRVGLSVKTIARVYQIDVRLVSFASADSVDKRSVDKKFPCGLCLRKIGLGCGTVAKLLPFYDKATWFQAHKRTGVDAFPLLAAEYRTYASRVASSQHRWSEGRQLRAYVDALELDAEFPDWSLDMIVREEMSVTGLTYMGAMYRVCNYAGRLRASKEARERHERLRGNSSYKLMKSMRAAVSRIKRFNSQVKCRKANQYLGCSIEHAARHIESQFKRGMNWTNHGRVWHIDHIIPLNAFDLSDQAQVLMCCHYTNLQPMWASDNIRKSDTVPTHQPELVLAY